MGLYVFKKNHEMAGSLCFSTQPPVLPNTQDMEGVDDVAMHPATADIIDDMDGEDVEEVVVYTGRKERAMPTEINSSASFWNSSFQNDAQKAAAAAHEPAMGVQPSTGSNQYEDQSDGVNTISFLGLGSPLSARVQSAPLDPRSTYSMPSFTARTPLDT